MIIIGVDFHPGFSANLTSVDADTGEFQEKRVGHHRGSRDPSIVLLSQKVRVGTEASGHARWFERLLAELQIELWIGDAAGNPNPASAQAEDGSARRAADSETHAEG